MPYNKEKHPKLYPLPYGEVYCELCRESIKAGQLVAWWKIPGRGGRKHPTAYCATCHEANLRAGEPIR